MATPGVHHRTTSGYKLETSRDAFAQLARSALCKIAFSRKTASLKVNRFHTTARTFAAITVHAHCTSY